MTADILFRLLLGHLVGDYLLQSNSMALNKKQSFPWAAGHCLVWTLTVCFCLLPEIGPLPIEHIVVAFALIWASHFALDYGFGTKFGLVDVWLNVAGSRSYARCMAYCESDEPELKKQFMVVFTAIVQTVADNALHLIFLYLIMTHYVLSGGV